MPPQACCPKRLAAQPPDLLCPKNSDAIGLQLYTVGALMEADTKGTLQKLAAIGYKNLESASGSKGLYYGYKPKEFASMVKDMGMAWRSEHVAGVPFTVSHVDEACHQCKRLCPNAEVCTHD